MVCLWSLFLPLLLSAQSDAANALVSGKVVDALTGKPLRGAKLTLIDMWPMISNAPLPPPLASVAADAEGKFLFERVPPGTYLLSADCPGYARSPYHPDGPRARGIPFGLEAGQRLDSLTLRMNPNASVSGRIRSPEGQALADVFVSLVQYTTTASGKWLTSKAFSSTDSEGRFAMNNVSPGEYLLHVQPEPIAVLTPPQRPQSDRQLSLTFYPGVKFPEAAQPISISAGQTIDKLDFVMQRQVPLLISGKVTPPARDLSVFVFPVAGAPVPLSISKPVPVYTDGSFAVRVHLPGEYSVVLMEGMPPRRSVRRTKVKLIESNIEDLKISYSPPLVLKGRVSVEGDLADYERRFGVPVDLTKLRLQLQAADGFTLNVHHATVTRQGSFEVSNLGAEPYRTLAYPLPPGTYLKSMSLGDNTVLDGKLDLQSGVTGEMQLVLSTAVASLRGRVVDAAAAPVAGVNVRVVKLPFAEHPAGRNRDVITDQHGRFSVEGLEPGEYRLFAYQFDPDHTWFNAANWPGVEPHTTWVNLQVGDNGELTLPLRTVPGRQ